jgi:MFS family permease
VQLWGRKNTMLIYIAGIFGQTFANGSLSAMYASRFIAGIGIGTTTVIPSIYITEVRHEGVLRRNAESMLTDHLRLRLEAYEGCSRYSTLAVNN